MLAAEPFGVGETHGILKRPENEIRANSDGRNWTSLYASAQREVPYEGFYPSVSDQLLVLHLDGPVAIDRMNGGTPQRHLVPAGGVHFVPGGMDFGVRLSGVLNTLHVYIRRNVMKEVAIDLFGDDRICDDLPARFLDDDPTLTRLLEAVNLALYEKDPASALYVDYLARAIASHLMLRGKNLRENSGKTSLANGAMSFGVARALDYMRENICRSISLDEMAQVANCSASHFARTFRQELGSPPHQYLIGMRLEMAQNLLANSQLPIAHIAFDCGFTHQEHMTRLFQRCLMTTPGAYRRARQT